jgi:hypothetical protein
MKRLLIGITLLASMSSFGSSLDDYLGTYEGKSSLIVFPKCSVSLEEINADEVKFTFSKIGKTTESTSIILNKGEVIDELNNDKFKTFSKITDTGHIKVSFSNIQFVER